MERGAMVDGSDVDPNTKFASFASGMCGDIGSFHHFTSRLAHTRFEGRTTTNLRRCKSSL